MPTAQERRHQRTRQEILDAALNLVEEAGIDGWSMRRLAGEVEYTVGALYRYFDDKAALLTALADLALAELYSRLEAANGHGTPSQRLEALALSYLAFAADEPTLFRVGLIEVPSRRRSLAASPGTDSAYSLLLAAVEDSLSTGEIVATEGFGEQEIAFTVWAMAHGLAVLETTHLNSFDAEFAAANRQAIKRLLVGLTGSE